MSLVKQDPRYNINLEFCGYPEQHFVLRFCGRFVESFKRLDHAYYTALGLNINSTEVVLDNFLIAALWSSCDNEDNFLDDKFSIEDIHPVFKTRLKKLITKWILSNVNLILNLPKSYEADQLGHDLWLTSQGHGVGFWSRGLGEVGDKLTESCSIKGFNCLDPYVGDDNLIYFSGCEVLGND